MNILVEFRRNKYGLVALSPVYYHGKYYRRGQFIPESYVEKGKPLPPKKIREYKREEPEKQERQETTERGKEKITTEKRKDAFRERMDVVFSGWNKKDWDNVKSIYQMQTVLTTNKVVQNTRRDEHGNAITTAEGRETYTDKATLNQSRLAWEQMKGRTYAQTRTGYTYSIKKYGLVALSPIIFRKKQYRKGQFLPKAYVSDR